MNRRSSFSIALTLSCLCLSALLSGACGGIATPGYSNQGKGHSCAELCEKSAECQSDVDVAECTQACTEDEVVSRAGQELLTDCATSLECEEIGGLDALECLEDGLFELPINEAQEDFCTITLDRLAECGGTPLTGDEVDTCLSGVAVLSDEFVTELGECGERRTCELVNLCAGLEILNALDEEQLEAILGGEAGAGLGSLGSLEDLLGSLGGSMGGAGPD